MGTIFYYLCTLTFVFIGLASSLSTYTSAFNENQSRSSNSITVHLPGFGNVAGEIQQTGDEERKSYQFFDIPYSRSRSGYSRFKPPERPESRGGEIYEAIKSINCPSIDNIENIRKFSKDSDYEDCLLISVISPNLSGYLPVFVYLISGDSTDDYDVLFEKAVYEKDILFVAVKYRYNLLGFLSTYSELIPGNVGVLDVIMALEWIQDYITIFGGDPRQVTLFGKNQGAAIAHLLTFSPVAPQNLFQRVIYYDSSALSPDFITHTPKTFASKLAKAVGCRTYNIEKCLIDTPLDRLLEADYNIFITETGGGKMFVIGDKNYILQQNPRTYMEQRNIRPVPTLGLLTKHVDAKEYLTKVLQQDPATFSSRFKEVLIEKLLHSVVDEENRQKWYEFAHKSIFSNEQNRIETSNSTLTKLSDLKSAITMKQPLLDAIKINAEFLPYDTHLFVLDHSKRPLYEVEDDELESVITERDENFITFGKIADILISFAITGRPDVHIDDESRISSSLAIGYPFTELSKRIWHYNRYITPNTDDDMWDFVLR